MNINIIISNKDKNKIAIAESTKITLTQKFLFWFGMEDYAVGREDPD